MFGRKWRALHAHVDAIQREIVQLRDDLSRSSTELADARRDLDKLQQQLEGMNGRVTHMSTAITNQLHELDSEIERLSSVADSASSETVNQLRANQVRIANEQARYAIALRQDLAELAELLRRSRA